MTKLKKILNKNVKTLIGFIIGICISGGIVYAANIAASSVTYTKNGQSTVQTALDDLYAKKAKLSVTNGSIGTRPGTTPLGTCTTPPAELSLGKYISITPSASTFTISSSITGYPSSQTINPQELTKWRIIKVNACNVEVVSEYTSSTEVDFRGIIGYRNYVGALNIVASAYENPTFTIGSRMIGYDGQTEFINDMVAFDGSNTDAPSNSNTPKPTSGTGQEYSGGVLGDTLYLADYISIGNVYKNDTSNDYGSTGLKAYDVSSTSTARNYHLNSRYYTYTKYRYDFYPHYLRSTSGGIVYEFRMRACIEGEWEESIYTNRVRPILVLKSGLTVKSGSGTLNSPYVLQ